MARGLDIGTLSGRIELEDNLSSAINLALGRIDALDQKFGGMGQRIAEGAASFFTAEVALKAIATAAEFAAGALATLTVEGAGAADIEENFNRLNEGAGRLGSTLITTLNKALHDTVTELDLMKLVNQDLAAGMNLTDDQFRTLAEGAFALAQATGTDVASAFDQMNKAMLTGQTRAVAMLTGRIDLAEAEKTYAESLNTTADRLTEEEKIQAVRLTVLEKVGAATARLGEQTDGIDEFVAQAAVSWENFQTALGKTVATSPVLMTGFIEIRNALLEAFGGSQEEAIRRIANAINEGAIIALEYAQTVVDGVALAGVTWNSFKIIIESVAQGYRAITVVTEEVLLGMMKVARFASGGSLFGDAIKATEQDIERLFNAMAQGDARITEFRAAQDQWAVSTGNVNEKIEGIRQKMIAANEQLKEGREATVGLTDANHDAADSAIGFAANQTKIVDAVRHTAEEAKKYKEAVQEMAEADAMFARGITGTKGILEGVSDEVERSIKKYLEAGIALDKLALAYELTDKQAKAIGDTWAAEKKQLDAITAAWNELNSTGGSLEETLVGVSSVVIAQVQDYMQAGASLAALKTAYGLTDAQIKAIQETLKTSEGAWAREQAGIANTAAQVRTLSGEWIAAAEAKERAAQGGAFEINRSNLGQSLRQFGVPESAGIAMAERGFSFQEILAAWRSGTVATWKPQGPKIPGFREGGVGDFGDGTLAMLHGREAIVPLDGAGVGNTVNNFFVNGTAEDVANKISNIIMQKARRGRQFGAA